MAKVGRNFPLLLGQEWWEPGGMAALRRAAPIWWQNVKAEKTDQPRSRSRELERAGESPSRETCPGSPRMAAASPLEHRTHPAPTEGSREQGYGAGICVCIPASQIPREPGPSPPRAGLGRHILGPFSS